MSRRLTTSEFIERAKQVHGDKYDYSKVEYVNNSTRVCIICQKHGEFWQAPNCHLRGENCPRCNTSVYDTESFIKKSNIIHNNKYDYSKVDYINNHTKVCIICPEHGEFWQLPMNHLKYECYLCAGNNKKDNSYFIKRSIEVHQNKYDYSKVNYINNMTPVCIICPEHGEFWQTPNNHLRGKGCSKCNQSYGERRIEKFLVEKNISYCSQYKNKDILENQSLDFYLPDLKIGIEYNGQQHYDLVNWSGTKSKEELEQELSYRQYLDNKKLINCKNNNIKLIIIPYTDYNNIESILEKSLL